MRVLKFGGTSIANAEKFICVADIIESNLRYGQVATVLSAPANITNHLIGLISKNVINNHIKSDLMMMEDFFTNLLIGITNRQPNFDSKKILQIIKKELWFLNKILHGISLLGQCPDSIKAAVYCRGEQFSVVLMTELLQARGHVVTIINPVEKLLAHGSYLDSTIDINSSSKRILVNNIPKHSIILMAGFTAGNEHGEPVILGRNGSDYSATVLAVCLKADCCEIWTDVDGVYTCDPRQVPNAKLLQYLSYQEAMELSYFGAKVLHPRTIKPIAQFQIPCRIKNTNNPNAIGTIIGNSGINDQVKGITQLNEMAMFNISGPGMKGMIGMAARVFAVMSQAGISVVLITQASSEYSISFCIPQDEQSQAQSALEEAFSLELKDGLLEPIEVIQNLAIITVVGDGIRTNRGIAARIFFALARANINIIAISQGSSERAISVVISNQHALLGIQAVHNMLFNDDHIIEIFLIGVGGVGKALLNQLHRQQRWLKKKFFDLKVCYIANSKKSLFKLDGISLNNWHHNLLESTESFNFQNLLKLLNNYSLINPVIVDCTSSQDIAKQYDKFIKNGSHIVTPNKKANTYDYNYYQYLRELAIQFKRKFLYDTNVGAGLPVIENLQNLLNAGDQLIQFSGILSGSLSFIFGKLEEGMTFSKATYLAREMGFTEPDPRDDLSGIDVARKLLILAREAGYQLELSDILVEKILPDNLYKIEKVDEFMQCLKELDDNFTRRVATARRENKVLRLVGMIDKDGICTVKIRAVTNHDPLYEVKNGENVLAFYTNYYQPIPMVLRGYGAGNDVTAAGIFVDLLRILTGTQVREI
ncbi:MAG: bifunctional aspartate kinase/homoserine dehydrogenase I [Candidatus Dasytiphilus stammeri]